MASSTTQIIARLRVGLVQKRQGSASVMLLQIGAFADFFFCFANGVGKRERLSAIDAQQIEGEALRRLLPDAGQAFEFVDQSRDGRREIRHPSSPCHDYCKVFRGSLGVKRKARSSRLRSQRFVARGASRGVRIRRLADRSSSRLPKNLSEDSEKKGRRDGMRMKGIRPLITLAFLLAAGALPAVAQQGPPPGGGPGGGGRPAGPPPGPPLQITSAPWSDGGVVPDKYSCAGPGGFASMTSPAVEWKNPPAGTQSFVLLLHDPDAHARKSVDDITHWIVLQHSRRFNRAA